MLGGLTVAFAIALIVALVIANSGSDGGAAKTSGSLSVSKYRLELANICTEHLRDAEEVKQAEGDRPVFGPVVQLERRTVDKIEALTPPKTLQEDHQGVVHHWARRLSLLSFYWNRVRKESDDPAFLGKFRRQMKRVDALGQQIQQRFVALRVTPECSLFSSGNAVL